MRKMRENIVPSLLRFAKSVRLQRGGGWKAVRVGVVALVVVVWVWVYLASPPAYTPPPLARGDWSSGSPNLQVAAPIREGEGGRRGGGGGGRREEDGGGVGKIEGLETWKINNVRMENKIQPIKVEDEEEKIIERREEGEGGRGQILIEEEEEEGEVEEGMKKSNRKKNKEKNKAEEEEEQEQETNPRYHNRIREGKLGLGKKIKDKEIFPNIFPKRRLILPGDTKLLEEEDEDDEEEEVVVQEEEEGKWKGRNKEEIDNHAMEEEDDVVGIGDKNDKEENNEEDKDFVEEDVGGEAKKRKKRQRREKRRETGKQNNNNNNNSNNNKNKNTIVHLENDPKNHLKENGNRGQGSHKEENDPAHDLRDLDLLAIEEEMRQRRSQVKQVCARYGLGPHAPPGASRKVKYPPAPAYETFYIDRGDKLAWCPVYKAASTSWLYGFLSLAGISESYVKNTKEQVSTVARRVWPSLPYDEAMEAVSKCVKAMVVRHPFERLVSAFRDKLEKVEGGEEHGTQHFYQKFGRKIVEKYRRKEKEENENGDTRVRGRENQRSIDAGRLRRVELEVDIDVRGGMSYGRVFDKGVRAEGQDEIVVKNGLKDVHKGNDEGNLAPPLRYTNAIDDTNPHHHQPPHPPPPPPPPPRYKHVLEDAPRPRRSPPIRFPDEIDDPHYHPEPPPQRYKHIIVEDSPPPQPHPEKSPKQGKEPTFREFVRYLIDLDITHYADDHWTPYHLSCTPCLVDFDVIAKFETLNRDQAFLVRKANLAGKLNFAWRHLTKGSRTEEVVKRYFAEVSKKELMGLYKKYKLDFEMFGYSVDEYLGYVKPE